ncbi:nuclear mRNA export, poly(A)+RNA binding protein, partial [Ceratobasidium sp. 395]
MSAPAPHPGTPTRKRPVALNALRTAGLIDPADSPMKDAAGPSRSRRTRVLDKSRAPRTAGGLAIRGVGGAPLPATRGVGGPSARPRRDALSKGSDAPGTHKPLTSSAAGRIMPIDSLRTFVNKRYNPELRFLNLENMAEDEALVQKNILPPDDENASRQIGPAILKLAGQLNPQAQPESISFANNNFSTLQPLHSLAKFLPNLKNISFQNNQIRLWKELECIIPHDPKNREAVSSIREIILMGNPVHDVEVAKGDLTVYRSEIIRRFPNLEMLDQESIIKIGFDVTLPEITERTAAAGKNPDWPASTSFLVDMKAGFMGPGIEATTVEFLTKYFTLFDGSRSQLMPAYSPSATFSLSLNTSIPPRARIRGYHGHLPRQKELQWKPWMDVGSRNLMRVAKLNKTTTFLRSTSVEVVKALEELPKTKHDVTGTGGAVVDTNNTPVGSPAAGKFVVDAFTCMGVLPGEGDAGIVLFVNVHGEFAEEPSGGLRSFDRVFVLAPASPDSPAHVAGWAVTILSDQLT